jgi:aminoglycoside 6'-N-acetyltransferase I
MTIRPLTSEDRAEWMRMRRALWPNCSKDRHELEMEQLGGGVVLVAEKQKGFLCGFVEISIRRDHVEGASSAPVAYLEAWYVDPGFQAQGVGRQLLKHAEQWASDHGFEELASDAELDNTRGIDAHRACGFTETGRSVHFIRRLSNPRQSGLEP